MGQPALRRGRLLVLALVPLGSMLVTVARLLVTVARLLVMRPSTVPAVDGAGRRRCRPAGG